MSKYLVRMSSTKYYISDGYNSYMNGEGEIRPIATWFSLERYAEEVLKKYNKKENMKDFTKSDLKTGMVVELTDDSLWTVMLGTATGDLVVDADGWNFLSDYNEDLTSPEDEDILSSIIKVYSSKNFSLLSNEKGKLLWERKTESATDKAIRELEEKLNELKAIREDG